MNELTRALKKNISQCMQKDQFRLKRELSRLPAQPDESALNKIQTRIEQSVLQRTQRAQNAPTPTYDDALPIVTERETIKELIKNNQVIVLCGETGSGKTTQLPKICLELGRGVSGLIGHTQPRRIAARSVAARISEELNSELGKHVGFKVRFADKVSEHTYIKLMTDGILLAETQQDRFLEQYDTLIIDEAHERSLNIDFLLGYIKQILPKRPDLKVIITSATIDPERFAKHFNDAPILLVEGRTYPVDVQYRPLRDDEQEKSKTLSLQKAIVDCLHEIDHHGAGDVLVFLAGERDIRETADVLQKFGPKNIDILPMYGRLSASEQERIFHPKGGRRRVVLSTNVAETSVTVPGIVYVVDTGMARISRYSYRSKVQRLPIEPVSQASANQRKGRCGRVSAGVCYRLYSEEDFSLRDEFTQPEVLRTNLAQVILQMISLRLGEINDFPFIDMPDNRFINDGYKLLFELGAIELKHGQYALTHTGKQMAKLPIDPKLGRMLIAGSEYNSLDEVQTIASFLSIQDPRERPYDKRGTADEKHAQWADENSDFLSITQLWFHYNEQKEKLSNKQLRNWCKQNFLSYLRMREWHDIRRQLVELSQSLKLKYTPQPATFEDIHKALLTGLLGNIGVKEERNIYLGPRNRRFSIFPGSNVKTKSQWVMAAEIFETSKVFAHTVAKIDPNWLEHIGAHLLKHTAFEPHFFRKTGHVKAFEKISLYGLVVNPKKRIDYAKVNAQDAHSIFVRDGLADMQLETDAEFMRHNLRLLNDIHVLEAKARRRDLLDDLQSRIDFFSERVPPHINNAKNFNAWRKEAERKDKYHLFLNRNHLITQDDFDLSHTQFPDTLNIHGLVLPLSYHFHPNNDDDGVSLHIPVAAINQVPAEFCDWLVAGMLEGKVMALIKTLPKSLRTQFVPTPEYAKKAMEILQAYNGDLLTELANALQKIGGLKLTPEDFNTAMLDNHYRMRFVVSNAEGKVLGTGRNLNHLKGQLAEHAEEDYYSSDAHDIEKDHIKRWSFGTLPKEVSFEQNGITLKGYPALVDKGESVSIKLIDTPEEQAHAHRIGLRKLFQLNLKDQIKYLRRNIPDIQKIALWYAPMGDKDDLINDIINAVTERVFLRHSTIPENQADFEMAVAQGKGQLVSEANTLSTLLVDIFYEYHQIRKRITGQLPLNWIEAAEDVFDQLDWLIYTGFLSDTPSPYLAYYPRYLKAISYRLDKLDQAPDKDRLRRAEIQPLWEQFKTLWNDLTDPQTELARWMIEELRVSQFAQPLGTKIKTSPQKTNQALEKLKKDVKNHQNNK